MAKLGLVPVMSATHSHSLAPRLARQCQNECRRRNCCRADDDRIALSIRQQLQCGQRFRSFPLVHGAGTQDAGAIAHPKSTLPLYPSIFVLLSSRGRRSSGEIECLLHLSVWKRSASSANASVAFGGTPTDEQLWEEYFVDTFQWWDNRVGKEKEEENTGHDARQCGYSSRREDPEELCVFTREIAGTVAKSGERFAQGHDVAHGSQSQGVEEEFFESICTCGCSSRSDSLHDHVQHKDCSVPTTGLQPARAYSHFQNTRSLSSC